MILAKILASSFLLRCSHPAWDPHAVRELDHYDALRSKRLETLLATSLNISEVVRAASELLIDRLIAPVTALDGLGDRASHGLRFPEEAIVRSANFVPVSRPASGVVDWLHKTASFDPTALRDNPEYFLREMQHLAEAHGTANALFIGALLVSGTPRSEWMKAATHLDEIVHRVAELAGPSTLQGGNTQQTVRAILEQLRFIKPDRVAPESNPDNYRLAELLEGYSSGQLGRGRSDCVGLSMIDSLVLMTLGIPVHYLIQTHHVLLTIPNVGRVETTARDLDQAFTVGVPTARDRTQYSFHGFLGLLWNNRGVDSAWKHEGAEAERAFHMANAIIPNYPTLRHNIGQFALMRDQDEQAVHEFISALLLDPTVYSYVGLGCALARLGLGVAAVEAVDRAHALAKNDPWKLHYTTLGFIEVERLDRAMVCVCRAIELSPGDSELYRLRAGVYSSMGDSFHAGRDRELARELEKGRSTRRT